MRLSAQAAEHERETSQARATIGELQAEVDALRAGNALPEHAEAQPQPAAKKVKSSGPGQQLREFAIKSRCRQQLLRRTWNCSDTKHGPPKISLPAARDDDERSFHSPSMVDPPRRHRSNAAASQDAFKASGESRPRLQAKG